MLQTLGTKTFSPKAFKQQCKVMENSNIKIPKQSLCIGTYRLIQINQLMPFLGIYAQPYTMEELNKIIVKSLLAKAMQKYVGDGSNNLDNITNILDLMLLIDTKLQLKQETAALEQQQNRMKSGNQQSNKGGKSTLWQVKRGILKEPLHKARWHTRIERLPR
jgi:hypothetical protein